jgi:hypothetical protein
MNRRILLTVSAVAALALAPSAQAANWVDSGPLSPPSRTALDPQVVLTPDGGRVVAWSQKGTDTFSPENISVRSAPPGGSFGDTQTFAGEYDEAHLAVGADGTVALAWVDGRAKTVHVARRAPGQTTFTEARPIAPSTEFPFGLDLAVTGGDAYVSFSSFLQGQPNPSSVWVARLGAQSDAVKLVTGTGAGGSVVHAQFNNGQPQTFVQSGRMSIDGGKPVVTWQHQTDGTGNTLGQTAIEFARGGTEAFAAPEFISSVPGSGTDARFVPPSIAAGAGHAYVFWTRTGSDIAVKDVDGTSTVLQVPSIDSFAGDLKARVDDSGNLVAAWSARPQGLSTTVVDGLVAPPNAPLPDSVRITRPGGSRHLSDLAVASDGTALALPTDQNGGFDTTLRVSGALRPSGAAFGPVEDVSGLQNVIRTQSHTAVGAVAPGGRALALWGASDDDSGPNQRLHLSERDTTAPVFASIAAPATAVVGQSAGFAGTATDDLSAATISWDFGDGSQADGGVVSHTFGTAGPALVTATATDSAGNTASQTRVVAVQPAPAPPGNGGGGQEADRTAPKVTRVSLTHRRFRVGKGGTAQLAGRKAKRSPAGTALRLTLDERSTLAVTIERRGAVHGTLVRAAAGPGKLSVPFSGRFGRTALPVGSYTASVVAIDGSGNRSKPVRVKFTVVKK